MKIENHFVEESTIDDFADKHNLTMTVTERGPHAGSDVKFSARFKNLELLDGSILTGTYGDGPTPEDAVVDYTRRISEKYICIDAMRSSKKAFYAPRFIQGA